MKTWSTGLRVTGASLFLLLAATVCHAQTTNTFPSSGNVGIGSTSPVYDLDIRTPYPEIRLMESASGGNKRLQINVGTYNEVRFTSTYGSGGNYPFTFHLGTYGEALRIAANGNVGIGVPQPLETFHTKGYAMFQRPDGANYIKIHSSRTGNYITSNDPGNNQKDLFFQVVSSASAAGKHMYFQTGAEGEAFETRMTIRSNGNIGIGTADPQAKLAVNGIVLATEVKVKADITVPDYVFEPDYNLPTLADVEAHIKEHKHLPEIPSAADIQRDGLNLAEMNLLLLKKVEELTLHLIQLHDDNTTSKQRIGQLEAEIDQLKSSMK